MGFLLVAALQAILIALDHFLDHLAADRTGLTRGQIAIVTLLEVYANFAGGFHLKTVEGFTCFGDYQIVTTSRH